MKRSVSESQQYSVIFWLIKDDRLIIIDNYCNCRYLCLQDVLYFTSQKSWGIDIFISVFENHVWHKIFGIFEKLCKISSVEFNLYASEQLKHHIIDKQLYTRSAVSALDDRFKGYVVNPLIEGKLKFPLKLFSSKSWKIWEECLQHGNLLIIHGNN